MRRRDKGWPIPPPAPRTATLDWRAAEEEKVRELAARERAAARANMAGVGVVMGGEEETVFGVPPAQRLAQQQQQLAQAQMAMHGGGLRMLGEDLLQDTIGIGQQMALAGRVEESPTPWNPRG